VREDRPVKDVFRAEPRHSAIVSRLLWDFNAEFATPCPEVPVLTRRFHELLDRRDVIVLLAGSAAEPTGFAFLTLRPTPLYEGSLAQLEELYVVPHLRDQGIGTALLTAFVDEVRRAGGEEIHINVDEVDVDTRRFYERHGFVNVEPGQDYRMLCYLRELSWPDPSATSS
jgi:ribosomal protein S18 acetylase RimI-like enzyme